MLFVEHGRGPSRRGLCDSGPCGDRRMTVSNKSTHIRLTSHPEPASSARGRQIHWGAGDPQERGPVIGTVTNAGDRNVIGTHGGAYGLYRALAVSAGALNPKVRPDLTNTAP